MLLTFAPRDAISRNDRRRVDEGRLPKKSSYRLPISRRMPAKRAQVALRTAKVATGSHFFTTSLDDNKLREVAVAVFQRRKRMERTRRGVVLPLCGCERRKRLLARSCSQARSQ